MTIDHVLSARVLPDESLAIDDRPGAYQWWYFDATSDDGEWTLVVIWFVGSVFSPWYAQRLADGERARPGEHPALNIALYKRGTPGALRWVFSEYGDARTSGRTLDDLRLGRSQLVRDAHGGYDLALDDVTPLFAGNRAVQGRVRFEPALAVARAVVIDGAGAHRWCPVVPRARVTVELTHPAVRFTGHGYHDMNHGDVPLAHSFRRWTWCRSGDHDGARIAYDRVLASGERRVYSFEQTHGSRRGTRGHDRVVGAPMELVRGAWALREPHTLTLGDETLRDLVRVERSPFYARYTARTERGSPAVGEHLDLERFASPIVRRMLYVKARRVP